MALNPLASEVQAALSRPTPTSRMGHHPTTPPAAAAPITPSSSPFGEVLVDEEDEHRPAAVPLLAPPSTVTPSSSATARRDDPLLTGMSTDAIAIAEGGGDGMSHNAASSIIGQARYYQQLASELQTRNEALNQELTEAHLREGSMLGVVDQFKALNQTNRSKRHELERELDAAGAALKELHKRADALLADNHVLRKQLEASREATSLANAGSVFGRSAMLLGVIREDDGDTNSGDGGGAWFGGSAGDSSGGGGGVMSGSTPIDRETALRQDIVRLQEALSTRTSALREAFYVIESLRQATASGGMLGLPASFCTSTTFGTTTIAASPDGTSLSSTARGAAVGDETYAAAMGGAASGGRSSSSVQYLLRQNAAYAIRVAELEHLLSKATGQTNTAAAVAAGGSSSSGAAAPYAAGRRGGR